MQEITIHIKKEKREEHFFVKVRVKAEKTNTNMVIIHEK